MRVFVSGVAADAVVAERAIHASTSEVSFKPAGLARVWGRRVGRTFGVLYSSDPDSDAGVVELGDDRVILWSGYTGEGSMKQFFDRHLSMSTGVSLSAVAGGVAAFSLIDFNYGRVFGWSSQPGVEPIYYSKERVSNRPLPICEGRPSFNADYLDWYMATGYPLDGVTPFQGVSSLNSGRMVKVGPRGVDLLRHPNPGIDYRECSLAEMAKQGVAALEQAIQPLHSFSDVELFLSNGKDSRLLAAGLHHCGVKAAATTMALTDRSAIRIVNDIARTANLPIRERPSSFTVDSAHKTLRSTLTAAEGMLNCEANVDMVPWPTSFDNRQAIIFGHSHLQKGGLLRGPVESKAHALNLLRRRFDNPLAAEPLRERVRTKLSDWMEQRDDVEPGHAVYWAAHDFRVTHYLRPHYHRFSSLGVPVYPLIDERFARFCGASSMMLKVDESFMFAMLNLMCPQMRDLPTSGHRWKFEIDGPDERFPGYESRSVLDSDEPLGGDPEQSIWQSSRLVALARDAILSSGLRDDLMSRVSPQMRDAVTAWNGGTFFPGAPSRRRARIQLYRMYSAAILAEEVYTS